MAMMNWLQQWLRELAARNDEPPYFEQLACLAVLDKWANSEALLTACRFRYGGVKKFSLKPDVAFALAWAITEAGNISGDYLGNYLRIIIGEIHQNYCF